MTYKKLTPKEEIILIIGIASTLIILDNAIFEKESLFSIVLNYLWIFKYLLISIPLEISLIKINRYLLKRPLVAQICILTFRGNKRHVKYLKRFRTLRNALKDDFKKRGVLNAK